MAKSKNEEFKKEKEKKLRPEREYKKDSKNKLLLAYNYLKANYEFRYNSISLEVEYRKKGEKTFKFFDDIAYRDIDQEVALNSPAIAERYFKNWVYGSKLLEDYDPFRVYIFGLDPWDGKTDHIAEFLQQVYLADEKQREYFIECFKRWFVAYVGGLVKDSIVNQTCFVLVSKQGRYKTTFLNSIVPIELRLDYLYSSTFIAHNKDHEKYLATKMLINLDEMQAFNRSDIESIKSKITQDRVVLRLPYAKADIKAWRKASFCGSVNRDEFLNDATGSRRFLPFKISDIAFDPEFNVGLLYAQALALFKSGMKYWFDKEDIDRLEAHNEPHKDKTMEEEFVIKHFRPPTKKELEEGRGVDYVTSTDIMAELCKKYEKLNANNTVKRNIGVALQGNGFDKFTKRRDDKPVKLWAVKEIQVNILENEDGTPINNDLPGKLPI